MSHEFGIQLDLSFTAKRQISFAGLSQVAQAVETYGSPVTVFFRDFLSEMKEINRVSQELKMIFEKCSPDEPVTVIHYYQLSSFLEESPPPGVVIVEHFHDFDEERLDKILNQINQLPEGFSWIILSPLWFPFRLNQSFVNWVTDKKKWFYFNPQKDEITRR